LNNKTYFFHFRAGSSPATIAFKVNEEAGLVLWDAAFCSSKDFFRKDFGRKVSEERLLKRIKNLSYLHLPITGPVNIRLIRREVMSQITSHPDCPQSFKV
jgi:hypothetical protein